MSTHAAKFIRKAQNQESEIKPEDICSSAEQVEANSEAEGYDNDSIN